MNLQIGEYAFTDHATVVAEREKNPRPWICPSNCQHLISFPSVLKALHHSSVFITVDLPVFVSALWW